MQTQAGGGMAPQGQAIIYSQTPRSNVKENYAALTSRFLGLVQIIGGILSIIFQGILIGILSTSAYSGAGIYCGILFILSGTFGYCAGKYRTFCWIVTYLVMAIVSCVFTIAIFAACGIALAVDPDEFKYRHNYDNHYNDYHFYNDYVKPPPDYNEGDWIRTTTTTPEPDRHEYYLYTNLSIAINSLLIITAFVELITLIWGSALTCKATCCGSSGPGRQIMVPVQYINGQAVVIVDQSGQRIIPHATAIPVTGPNQAVNMTNPTLLAGQPTMGAPQYQQGAISPPTPYSQPQQIPQQSQQNQEEKIAIPESPPPNYQQ